MKILRFVFIGIVSVVALAFIVGLFIPKEIILERQITITRPKQVVFDYIVLLRNQIYFNKWVMTDPNVKFDCRGTDGTVGFIQAWEGNQKAGKGEQEIKKVVNGEVMEAEIRFEKPFVGTSWVSMAIAAVSENETLVKWKVIDPMPYPMNIMGAIMNLKAMLGKDMEISLENLKRILEK